MLFVLFLLSLLTSAVTSTQTPLPPSNGTSIYAVLAEFALPPGLLPDSVKSFSVANDGHFQVQLESPCYADFDYLVYYDSNITGVIRYGGIYDLTGVQVRKLLIWFDVEAIKVDLPPSDYIYFEIGWVTKKLRLDQFLTVHSCRRDKLERIVQFSEPRQEMGLLITE